MNAHQPHPITLERRRAIDVLHQQLEKSGQRKAKRIRRSIRRLELVSTRQFHRERLLLDGPEGRRKQNERKRERRKLKIIAKHNQRLATN